MQQKPCCPGEFLIIAIIVGEKVGNIDRKWSGIGGTGPARTWPGDKSAEWMAFALEAAGQINLIPRKIFVNI